MPATPSGIVKKDGANFFVRYANSNAWLFLPEATGLSECRTCCPNTSLTLWEDPNVACSDLRITHPIDLISPFFHIHQPITSYLEAAKANNRTAVGAYNALCGSPPQANLSSIITIQIPYDPIFSGTYSFSYAPVITGWKLITTNNRTLTSLPNYSGLDASRQGPFQNKKLISLEQTLTEPTYKGYTEVSRSGDSNSNISGVFAFPAHFVFSALCPPTDIGTSTSPSVPTTSGHRAVLGFTVPIRWRKEYFDWIVSDQGVHKVSGSKYSDGWSPIFPDPRPVSRDYWIPSTNLSVSGYAISRSGSNTIGLSGITNNPATYDLSNLSTAITGSCSMSFTTPPTEWSNGYPVPYSGLAHMGFCYRTSASGLPYHQDNVMDLNDFMGIRQVFNNGSTINTTRLLGNKQDMEAWITFPNSCRTSGTTCSAFGNILGAATAVVPTGYTMISGTCVGSYINADFSCKDNVARPTGTYLANEGITGIKPLYLGTSDNVYPFVRVNSSSGNVYMAGSGQNIFIDYNGPHTLDGFREWVNKEFSFVEISGNNNAIINQWPGVDLYWQNVGPYASNTAALTYPDIMFARLIPCDSAAQENSAKGLYVLKINNTQIWDAAGQPGAEFLGRYGYDSYNNRYILLANNNIQIWFIVDRWYLGKIQNNPALINYGTLVQYYALQYAAGGDPTLGDSDYYTHFDPNDFNDYSSYPGGNVTNPPTTITWNTTQIPVNCLSVPIGQWNVLAYAGTGVAITVIDSNPVSYNANNPC